MLRRVLHLQAVLGWQCRVQYSSAPSFSQFCEMFAMMNGPSMLIKAYLLLDFPTVCMKHLHFFFSRILSKMPFIQSSCVLRVHLAVTVFSFGFDDLDRFED